MRLGSHVSIANRLYEAVDRARASGCETMQIFPGNPRGWKPSSFPDDDMAEFTRRRTESNIYPLVIHLPYLVNLGSSSDRVFQNSIGSIRDALQKAKVLEADFLVMHTGSHGGQGASAGTARLVEGLKDVLTTDFGPVKLLLENMAGAEHALGSRLEQFEEIFGAVDFDKRLGICFDTCHTFAAGYNIAEPDGLDAFLKEFDDRLGLDRLAVAHANDSKGALGSHLDRHEHIGKGEIGASGWRTILGHPDLQELPFILETPRTEADSDETNLATLKRLAAESAAAR